MNNIHLKRMSSNEANNTQLMEKLATIINRAYKTAETRLWKEGMQRTDAQEMSEIAASGELIGMYLDETIIGSVRLTDVSPSTGNIGMLAIDENYHGRGFGKQLLQFAEHEWKKKGIPTIQIELLVAKSGSYPAKERLEQWYVRIGYQEIERKEVQQIFPPLTNMLAVPSEFIIFHKRTNTI
ncbi:MAG TPA: GNAT family N-acetyltransferase [Bacillota bacterium]|nr:GNAT family N-acetyltransferase [Bacillota bacterium]